MFYYFPRIPNNSAARTPTWNSQYTWMPIGLCIYLCYFFLCLLQKLYLFRMIYLVFDTYSPGKLSAALLCRPHQHFIVIKLCSCLTVHLDAVRDIRSVRFAVAKCSFHHFITMRSPTTDELYVIRRVKYQSNRERESTFACAFYTKSRYAINITVSRGKQNTWHHSYYVQCTILSREKKSNNIYVYSAAE